jgi:hypothetical protein
VSAYDPFAAAGPYPPSERLPGDRSVAQRLLVDLAIVTGWFAAAGLLGAVVWELVTPLAEYTRTADNGTMGEEELARQFGATGWYLVIGAVAGVVSGAVLLMWRRRSPVLMVLMVAAGGALAAWVMLEVGLALGPADPNQVLATVDVGEKVPLRLKFEGPGAFFVWPIAALAGALFALLFFESRDERLAREERLRLELPTYG